MALSSADAKKEYFLTAHDLKGLPYESLYAGFGTGRAMKLYTESDLEEAAIAKHGTEGLAKKRAARQKREDNKRKREAAAIANYEEKISSDPTFAKHEAAKKQKAEDNVSRNEKIAGDQWNLTITSPECVEGTKATLKMKEFPPTGWPGEAFIDCGDYESPAYSYGNIHGFKGKSSEADKEMVFETKWKVCGVRHKGTLRVQVKPSDKKSCASSTRVATSEVDVENAENKKSPEADEETNKVTAKASQEEEEEDLMVTGKFDCGVNANGVRSWTFKGYRNARKPPAST